MIIIPFLSRESAHGDALRFGLRSLVLARTKVGFVLHVGQVQVVRSADQRLTLILSHVQVVHPRTRHLLHVLVLPVLALEAGLRLSGYSGCGVGFCAVL